MKRTNANFVSTYTGVLGLSGATEYVLQLRKSHRTGAYGFALLLGGVLYALHTADGAQWLTYFRTDRKVAFETWHALTGQSKMRAGYLDIYRSRAYGDIRYVVRTHKGVTAR